MIFIALITLFGGYLMKIYAWKTILGNEGVINSTLIYFHIIKEPLTFLLYTKFGLIITFVHFLLPFAILPTYASLRGVNSIEIDSMKDLGAKFYHVQFMLFFQRCRTGVLASFVFCLLIVSGDFLTPYLIGGKITFIGNMIAPKFGKFFDWPLGSAMSFTMLTTSILIIGIVSYLFKLTNPK